MYLEDFPYCCTAKVLCDFPVDDDFADNEDVKGIDDWIRRNVHYCVHDGVGLITATTTNQQKIVRLLLKKHGFKSTKYFSKDMHEETRLKLWYLPIESVKDKY